MEPGVWQEIGELGASICVEATAPQDERPASSSGEFWAPRIAASRLLVEGDVSIAGKEGYRPEIQILGKPAAVSFSRTAGGRSCVIRDTGRVGIDIERRTELADANGMLEIASSRDERDRMFAVFGEDSSNAVLRVWTAKEALLKAIGLGLSVDPKSVELSDIGIAGCQSRCRGQQFRVSWFECLAFLVAVAGD